MKILDCESLHSTILSISDIFGCNQESISDFLNGISIESYYNDPVYPHYELLLRSFVSKFGEPRKIDYICWFHLTRTDSRNTFEDGILPLGKGLEKLWTSILRIFEGTEHHSRLLKMKETGFENFQYNLKVPARSYWGPHANLIKEIAFNVDEARYHNYLKIPEIIDDICDGYRDLYDISIHQDIIDSLRPCIVKFKSTKRLDIHCIRGAIYYIYNRLKNKPLSPYSDAGFDAEAQTIPKNDILKIEYLES